MTHRVIERIWEVTAPSFDKAQAGLETSLRDDLGLKSMDAVAVALVLEDEFDIVIETKALVEVQTIGDAVSLVRRLKSGSPS